MERLTEHHVDGKGAYMKCSEFCQFEELDCERCEKSYAIINRLAAYEDTGLEPEEIYQQRFLIAVQKDPEKLAHLRDLVLADEAGRLVVLPCKVGDMIYEVEPLWLATICDKDAKCRSCKDFYEGGMGDQPCCLREDKGNGVCLTISEKTATLSMIADWMEHAAFDKTVFLNREEAEAALRKESEHG